MRRDNESTSLLLLLKELDASGHDVSSWEADFIENVLHGDYHGPLSEKQKSVIYQLQDKYPV